MAIAITLHLLAVVVWIGGMFFAHHALRPVAAALLEPPHRLPLWVGVFKRFFVWVWISVIVLPATGYWMIFSVFGGFAYVGLYIHIMNLIGLIMIGLFIFVFFSPYQQLKTEVAANNYPEAAKKLALIRKIVVTNLNLGLLNVCIASLGRYWS